MLMGNEVDAAKSQASSVIEFELGLANIFIPELERRNEKVSVQLRVTITSAPTRDIEKDWFLEL